ncbi:ABC-F family ATP-binding cassette domain-containing protein, partial [Desulfotalea psychrophila]|nr:ABC-F family ATP-binding cassette domain-containing protein [Desulfotalea psychrophila]
MVHLNNISKQYGSQILFTKASLQILPGIRTGMVGPNGAGKSTIFRLITGEEEPDKGEISCSKKTVLGYFSQEVGEMSGRSALEETMSAVAAVIDLAQE